MHHTSRSPYQVHHLINMVSGETTAPIIQQAKALATLNTASGSLLYIHLCIQLAFLKTYLKKTSVALVFLWCYTRLPVVLTNATTLPVLSKPVTLHIVLVFFESIFWEGRTKKQAWEMGQKIQTQIQKPFSRKHQTHTDTPPCHSLKTSLTVTRSKASFPMRTPSSQERQFTIPMT